ncbi:MAG: pyruvate kinase [Verrucomicrobiota bacterium]
MPSYYRHTKIIATLGPATDAPEMLEKLIREGVDILRLNMAHTTPEWVADTIGHIRAVSEKVDRHVAVLMDVKGPEIRTARLSENIPLELGDSLEFYIESSQPTSQGKAVSVNYPGLPEDVQIGATVLVDSGLLRMKVVRKTATSLFCEVLTSGSLGSKRHINLPGVHVNLPSLTAKDEADLEHGIGLPSGIDFVALSFVRQAEDIATLRRFLTERGSRARIIAKIEDQAGVRNMEEIVSAADGIMVARGDLGIEIAYPKLPLVQREMVASCQAQGKPVIIATHLLESMITSPMPTRAEISDVSNAIREQADAVMLSGETTTGRYPLEAVQTMKEIIESIEPSVRHPLNKRIQLHEPKAKMLRSAAVLAQELGKSGIVVFSRSGFLPYVLGALRPCGRPIFAFTDDAEIFRQLTLPWGVEPFHMPFCENPEDTILDALAYLKRGDWVEPGTWLVVITNALAHERVIDTLQLRQVE